jgi:ectoine hydroxylase
MASGIITADQLTEYRKKGYTLVRRMFDQQEIGLLGRSAKQDKTLDDHAFGRDDGLATHLYIRSQILPSLKRV